MSNEGRGGEGGDGEGYERRMEGGNTLSEEQGRKGVERRYLW